MNSPSARVRKRRAPQRRKPGAPPNLPVPLRRSPRLQSKPRSSLIAQSFLDRPPAPQAPYAHLPTSDPVNALIPPRAQLQDLLHTHTRERGPSGSIENYSERPIKRACLTERNLKAHTKLENMRRHKKEPKGSSRSGPGSSLSKSKSLQTDDNKSSSKTVSTTDSSFARLAFKNGVLDPLHSKPPENLVQRRDRQNRERDTESPTESEFNNFSYRVQTAPNEMSMLVATSTLLKGYKPGYHPIFNQAMTNFPKNVGFNDGLSAAQPDMVEGLDLTQFHPFPVDEKLGGAAVPTSERDTPTLSHLAGEWKGPGKDMIEAQTQAAYDGACLVHGRNRARSLLGDLDPPSHAFVSTFTTDGTILNTYLHYSSQSDGQVRYHQYPTSTSLLRSSYEDYKTAWRRVRNDQDDAKENSEKLRDELNEKWLASQQYAHKEDDNDNEHSIPQGIQTKTAYPKYYDTYLRDSREDDKDEPSTQLLVETEQYTSFSRDDNEEEEEEEDVVQIPTPDASSAASKPRRNRKKRRTG